MISISNPYMTVALSPEGGSLTSIRNAQTGREYLWQGDPAYLDRAGAELFPFVGRLYEKTYTLHGKAYPMTIHGFVRHAQMEVESQAQSACSFLLTDSPETREIYPYRFAFRIRYALERATLQIVFQVENRSEAPLYCGMGGHPGFQVPLEDGLQFEDYELTFPEPCTPGGYCSAPPSRLPRSARSILWPTAAGFPCGTTCLTRTLWYWPMRPKASPSPPPKAATA